MWAFRRCSTYWLLSKASFSHRIWWPCAVSRKGFRDLLGDADGLQLPTMPRAAHQPPAHLAGKGKPRADDLQDLLALRLVCSQGRAWSPAFLQGLSTYFLLKTKYTKSPPGTEWNSGLCPLLPEHIWEPFPRRAEQLHGERGKEGGRPPCSATEESEGRNGN